jgi:hypothetical protein
MTRNGLAAFFPRQVLQQDAQKTQQVFNLLLTSVNNNNIFNRYLLTEVYKNKLAEILRRELPAQSVLKQITEYTKIKLKDNRGSYITQAEDFLDFISSEKQIDSNIGLMQALIELNGKLAPGEEKMLLGAYLCGLS